MSRKSNTVLFITAATVFNILVTFGAFTGLLLFYGYVIVPALPPQAEHWGLPFIFLLAVAFSFAIYRLFLNLLTKKVDMQKHFGPVFRQPGRAESGKE
ncbi:MAG: leader peptide processing enzyme [Treponematales bacterium]